MLSQHPRLEHAATPMSNFEVAKFFVETKCHFQKEIPPRFIFVPIGLSTKVPVVYNHDQKLDLRRFGGWVLVNDPDEQFVTRPKTATGHFALSSGHSGFTEVHPVELRLVISQR